MEDLLVEETPLEVYRVESRIVHVKREDMCCRNFGPPFSKMRGVYKHLLRLKKEGCSTIGYVDTKVSMAGWGVAWCAKHLGLRAVVFDPQYQDAGDVLPLHRKKWEQFGAEIVPIQPSRMSIVHARAEKIFREKFGQKAILLKDGLPFDETIEETSKQWRRTAERIKPRTTVVVVGSGTICAGILSGWNGEGDIVGILCASKLVEKKQSSILRRAGVLHGGLFGVRLQLVDPGWTYTEPSLSDCPFPCNRYYDLKAWQWLVENINRLEGPILFWNIGRNIDDGEE